MQLGIPILVALSRARTNAGTRIARAIETSPVFRCFLIDFFVSWGKGSDSVKLVTTHVKRPTARAPVTNIEKAELIRGPTNWISQKFAVPPLLCAATG